ncbi:MAG TPA: hypothetical protein VG052_06945 [Puia sp.]|nr:hypothetical protein [Puia sp.]
MKICLGLLTVFLLSLSARGQNMEKVIYDAADSSNGYYLAVPPVSHEIRGVLILFCDFRSPESLLPETRLHNIASAGDLLTVYASLGASLLADSVTLLRMNAILQHITAKYSADTSTFIIGGFDLAGTIVLRFAELAWQDPGRFVLRPKAVLAAASCVDLTSLYHTSERQIKKNYFPPAVGDAHYILGVLQKECGTPEGQPESYRRLSPFLHTETGPGNEQYLDNVAVRLYYDADISWQLNARRNSLYDTDIPDATELINRLLLAGNNKAEFIPAKAPGVRSNGQRSPNALSIVDETDCIQWVKGLLHIIDFTNPRAWIPPYKWPEPTGWRSEASYIPGPNSPHFPLKGIEDIRFPPGWGVAGSEEYWSVAYLFWLDGGQKIDADILQGALKTYYDELIAGALIRRRLSIAPGTIKPVQVTIKKIAAEPDDRETYTGTIAMFDYLGQKPMTLNYLVHVKTCSAQGHIPMFLEISPKPFEHLLWSKLKEPKQKFSCEP